MAVSEAKAQEYKAMKNSEIDEQQIDIVISKAIFDI